MQQLKINSAAIGAPEEGGDGFPSGIDIRLFKGFPETDLHDLASFGYVQRYYQNDIIIPGNSEDRNVYILIDGNVVLWKLNAPVLTVKNGEAFNEAVVFFPSPGSVVARSEQESLVFKIARDSLKEYFSGRPERLFKIFTLNMIAVMQQKIVYYESCIARTHHRYR